jgi:hypothetical protein
VPPRPRSLTRRTTLALAGLGVVALTGCDDKGSPSSGPTSTPSADPDEALVDGVVEQVEAAWQQARRARDRDLRALHAAHLEALGAPAPTPVDSPMPRESTRRVEQRLHDELVTAAMAASSGDLARLLASMSAAVSQRLETL